MSKTTQELKDAVEARIDVEQRKLILQILSKDELDEPTTVKLQQLMREVEQREQKREGSASQAQPVDLAPPAPEPARAPKSAMPDVFMPQTPSPAKEAARHTSEESKTASESVREKELAELERKNAEMSQLLEQLTKEKQNTLINHLAQEPDLNTSEFAYHAHHITERLNKDEPGWFRIYFPLIVLIILIGLAIWAFFTFAPIQATL